MLGGVFDSPFSSYFEGSIAMPVVVVVKPSHTICGAKDDDLMQVTNTGVMDQKVLTCCCSGLAGVSMISATLLGRGDGHPSPQHICVKWPA